MNFGRGISGERAGITKQVTLNGNLLLGWHIYSLPLTGVDKFRYASERCNAPCFYRGSFRLSHLSDTFLDTSDFNKGELLLNGRTLGRVWKIEPQKTLYAPAPWLKKGRN